MHALLAALALSLQQQPDESIPRPQEELAATAAPTWRVQIGAKELFDANFDSTPGELGLRRWSGSVSYAFPAGETDFALTPYLREYDFRFQGRTPFGAGAPFGDIHVFGCTLEATQPLARNLAAYGSFTFENAQESGARLSGNTGKILSYAGWDVDEHFTLFLGVFHLQGIEQNITVPIVGFDWDFWEDLGFVSDEEGTRLEYRPTSTLRLDLGADGDVFQARLSPSAASPDGVLQYLELDLGVRAVWKPSDAVQLAVGVLVEAFADIELQDSSGAFRGNDQLEPAPVLYLSARLSF